MLSVVDPLLGVIPDDGFTVKQARLERLISMDALFAQCAERVNASYIITRNVKDFVSSPVPAMEPDMFLDKFFKE